jgi:hypothetical protein
MSARRSAMIPLTPFGATAREAAMVLVVIDTQTHTRRTFVVPVKAGHASPEPARIIAYTPRG